MRNEHRVVLLTTTLFFLVALSITMITPMGAGRINSGVDATSTLSGNSATAFNVATADEGQLSNEAYAHFQMAKLDIELGEYRQVFDHVRAVQDDMERRRVSFLVLNKLLTQPCMSVYGGDAENAGGKDARCRSETLDAVVALSQTVGDPALQAAHLVRLAEEQFLANNRLSPDEDRSWEQLRAAAQIQLDKVYQHRPWWGFDYRYVFTAVFTGCGFVVSLLVKEVVGVYSKSLVAHHVKGQASSNETKEAAVSGEKRAGDEGKMIPSTDAKEDVQVT